MTTTTRPPLRREVEEVENRSKPGCNSSSTSRLCACPSFSGAVKP